LAAPQSARDQLKRHWKIEERRKPIGPGSLLVGSGDAHEDAETGHSETGVDGD
jgi:hypothetical protein